MHNLTWEQEVELMKQGKRVTHEYFTDDEYLEMVDGHIVCERGYRMGKWNRGEEWQQKGFKVL